MAFLGQFFPKDGQNFSPFSGCTIRFSEVLKVAIFLKFFTLNKKKKAKCNQFCQLLRTVFYCVWCALFYIEKDAEIFPAHYTWKVAEKGFKIAFMMNKLAMIISFEIILEK